MTEEKIKKGIDCCYTRNQDCRICPYSKDKFCKEQLLSEISDFINDLEFCKTQVETQLKELLSVLYQRTDEKGFTIYRKDIVGIAKDYGYGEEELK